MVHFVHCDVTKDEDLDNLIQAANTLFGAPVDIFVNNAGISTILGWRKCMEVNIMAMMSATEKVLVVMRNRDGCKIINIGSLAGMESNRNIVKENSCVFVIIFILKNSN